MCSHPRERQFTVAMRNQNYEVDVVQCHACGDIVPSEQREI